MRPRHPSNPFFYPLKLILMATSYHSDNVRADKDGHNDSHGHVDPIRSYLLTFGCLMCLLFMTYGAYFIPFERVEFRGHNFGWVNTLIALTIASVKTLFVLLIFMHLKHSTKLTWVVASAGFVWLCIMVIFTFADYSSRGSIREIVKEPLDTVNSVTLQPEPGNTKNNASWAE